MVKEAAFFVVVVAAMSPSYGVRHNRLLFRTPTVTGGGGVCVLGHRGKQGGVEEALPPRLGDVCRTSAGQAPLSMWQTASFHHRGRLHQCIGEGHAQLVVQGLQERLGNRILIVLEVLLCDAENASMGHLRCLCAESSVCSSMEITFRSSTLASAIADVVARADLTLIAPHPEYVIAVQGLHVLPRLRPRRIFPQVS